MTQSGAAPAFGVRFELVLALDGERYEGVALISARADAPSMTIPLVVELSADAARARVSRPMENAPSAELVARVEKLASALVRAATRSELESGEPPPRKIVRWRPFE